MPFSLPELPYPHDALAPYMSRETLEYHHDKHHLAYVDTGNKLIKGTRVGRQVARGGRARARSARTPAIFNNAGQHWNHIHFWKWMKPNGGGFLIPGESGSTPLSRISAASTSSRRSSKNAGIGQFGSGWAWLVVEALAG